ncbi:hypothetical protein SAMN04489860_0900 [Paraoerskovia marina]|uniref:Lipoprotein n=1 Tax=Paraoerskovia marina TaxID=545619 RepID=A0A1H1PTP0_9CELL|nr:hypothetical protein [Paraoerskovia marina]SDS14463.1 hypothetical protein SAMN04489860_0900 [Paraoerskovia marina]
MLTKFVRKALPVLAVVALAAGCSGDEPAPAAEPESVEADGQVQVGSFNIEPAEYWSVTPGDPGVTTVRVGGCPDEDACPEFQILERDAIEEVDVSQPYVPEGATCPGSEGLSATATDSVESSDATVAGSSATLMVVQLSCVDDAGDEVRTAEQRQWFTEEAPEVLVVDRWAFEGLDERLASATVASKA